MTDSDRADQPPRSAALTAGLSLLVMSIAAPVAVFVLVPRGQLVSAAVVLLSVAVLDAIVGVALHVSFGAHARRVSLLAAALRVVYAAMLLVAVRHLVISRSPTDFQREWSVGLGVFGLHLLVLGGIICRREGWVRALGVLVLVAGAGYVIDCVGATTSGHTPGLARITFVGELILMVWLLWKGLRRSPSRSPCRGVMVPAGPHAVSEARKRES